MKGQISRYSWSEARHYSGVYQIQGGMVTDADLGETSEIARARTDQLGGDAIRTGVPHIGGIFEDPVTQPVLRPGTVYADGVRGVVDVRPGEVLVGAALPFDLYAKQADYPAAPAVTGEGLYYVDIWQRTVSPVLDPDLTDVGLHRTPTSFRGKTMAQIRWARALPDLDSVRDEIGRQNGRFPKKGNGLLTASFINAGDAADPCDPCREEDAVAIRVPNALLRLEVVDVVGPANNTDSVDLAWSLENGAEQYDTANLPQGFGDSGVFEYFSDITEQHIGAFDDAAQRMRSLFVATLAQQPPDRTDGASGAWPLVRRWDGHAAIKPANQGSISNILGQNIGVTIGAGRTVIITTDSVTLTLDLGGKSVIAGDYWLVELREFGATEAPIVLNGGLPVGIDHHYCVLVANDANGNTVPLNDATRRRLSFPALNDIPASHVSIEPNTCDKLFGAAENVQDALRALCGIKAADIAFTSNCENLFGTATTVQEALDHLCTAEIMGNTGYRELFDWGAVCGLDVRLESVSLARVRGGTFLDRAGRFARLPEDLVADLNDRNKIKVPVDLPDGDGEFCICIALDEKGAPQLYIVRADVAFGPRDPGFCERVTDCQGRGKFWEDYLDIAVKPEDQVLMKKVVLATSQKQAFGTTFKLTKEEEAKANAYVGTLNESFRANSTDAQFTQLNERTIVIENKYRAAPIDQFADLRRGQRIVDLWGNFGVYADERLRDCVRDAIIVPCPPELGPPPYYVPLARLIGVVSGGQFTVSAIQVTKYRKQALTMRAMRYRQRGGWENDLSWFEGYVDSRQYYKPGELLGSLAGFQRSEVFLKGDCLQNATNRRTEFQPPPVTIEVPPKDIPPWEVYWPPREVFERPDIVEVPLEDARKVLTNIGVEVVNTIDVTQPDALDKVLTQVPAESLGTRLRTGEPVNPGDKVVLLRKGTDSVGYMVVGKGIKTAFEQQDIGAIGDQVALDLNSRVKEAEGARDAIRTELEQLTKTRDALVLDIGAQVKQAQSVRENAVAELDKTRQALQQQISDMKVQVIALSDSQVDFAAKIEASKVEIASFDKQREVIVASMRNAAPVVAINADPTLNARLASGGLTSVGDINKLSEADVTTFINRGVIKDRNEAKQLRDAAATFARRPVS